MKTKIKYDVLYYDGRRGKKTVTYECPDFEEKIFNKVFDIELPEPITLTIEKQIDSWVGEFDKAVFMSKNDIKIIFDWKVISVKHTKTNTELIVKDKVLTNEDLIKLFASMLEDEQVRLDFIAVYSKMKSTIKNLHYKKQIEIVIDAQIVGYKSVIASHERVKDFGNELKKQIKGNGERTDYIYRVTKESVKQNI